MLVGAGDALTFISVLSVVTAWFPARRVPLMTQLTGLLGQLGQVLSAVPLAALLHGAGLDHRLHRPRPALGRGRRDRGAGRAARPPAGRPGRRRRAPSPAAGAGRAGASWREPGTRLGLWTHMGTQFSGTVFALLWGVPYLVAGQGLSPGEASALLTLFVLGRDRRRARCSACSPPGIRCAGPGWCSRVILLTAATWTVVLAVPPPAPAWLLVVLVVVLALGGPGSMIGFDYARTFNPGHRQGTAVGIVNVGGFVASLLVSLADRGGARRGRARRLHARGVPGGLDGAVRGVGASRWSAVLVARRRARRKMAAAGVVVPPLREVLARRRRPAADPGPAGLTDLD